MTSKKRCSSAPLFASSQYVIENMSMNTMVQKSLRIKFVEGYIEKNPISAGLNLSTKDSRNNAFKTAKLIIADNKDIIGESCIKMMPGARFSVTQRS